MIWVASSRVGANTRPDGRDGRRRCPASLLTNGIEKASVFPLPVLPRPSTSFPASVSGRVWIWMGNGSVMPRAASALINGSRDAEIGKSLVGINVWCLSASVVPSRGEGTPGRSAQGGEIAGGQNRSPRYELCWCTDHLNRCFGHKGWAGAGGMKSVSRRVGRFCRTANVVNSLAHDMAWAASARQGVC